MTTLDTDQLIRSSDAARLAGIAPSTFSTYVMRGYGPKSTKVAGYTLFLRSDVEEWLAKRPGQGARTDLST